MKLAVFGATGRTGRHLLEQALDAGHEVTALARNPAKLALQNEHLTIVQGDIQDAQAVNRTISGADAVMSVLGPSSNTPDFAVSKGMENILAIMKNQQVRRLIISAGAGVADPNDNPGVINHAISFLLKTTSRYVYEDMLRVVKLVRESDRDWTVVRVPMLIDQPKTGVIRVGYVGKGTGARLTRADMAAFMLQQLDDQRYLGQAPVISN